MPKVSGFTIVRNAVKLDFPIEASIRSILPICDEVIVAVGASEDDTLDRIRGLGEPKVKIVETEWDLSLKSQVLAQQTQLAMRHCQYPWGIYIQADEVLHERGAETLGRAIAQHDGDPRVEGLLVRYLHFYGDMDTIAVNRRWYRREVRAMRLDPALDIRPYQGAQGFRVGPENRKIRARLTDAEMFHYGWARPAQALRAKREASAVIYPWSRERESRRPLLPWFPGLTRFQGSHPAAARAWVDARRDDAERRVEAPHFRTEFLRFYLSDVIERLTAKLVRRHPHVFAGANAATSAEVLANWSRIKREERGAVEGGNAEAGIERAAKGDEIEGGEGNEPRGGTHAAFTPSVAVGKRSEQDQEAERAPSAEGEAGNRRLAAEPPRGSDGENRDMRAGDNLQRTRAAAAESWTDAALVFSGIGERA